MSFSIKNKLVFVDKFQFLNFSFDSLVKNFSKDNYKYNNYNYNLIAAY